jgi:alpha(1,3/1,4) fucosyltransferase
MASLRSSRPIALYIDPPTHHFLGDRMFDINTVRFIGDHLLAPWAHLREFFISQSIKVHTADLMPADTDYAQNFYVSIGNLANYRKIAQRGDTVLSAFFALECPIVEPSLYRGLHEVQHYFKRIFSWSDSSSLEHFTGGPLPLMPFRFPQAFSDVHEPIWKRSDRKFLVMINSNKLPRLYWQELYTERLRAVEFFARTGEIDLYGHGWDQPSIRVGKTRVPHTVIRLQRALLQQWQQMYPDPMLAAARRVYRGRTESKAETLGQHKFALCFENAIIKGYITEKIFDCFFAGTVPIYWGAPNIEEVVPSNCFIDMRCFASYAELRSYLISLSEKDICTYKENAWQYIKSPQFRPFTKEAFAEIFAQMIEEDL